MNCYDEIKLVGLSGKAGSGKDTVADGAVKRGWEKVAFADALKEICVKYLGLSKDDVYTQEGKRRYNRIWGMTNREILQKVGTEGMRNGFCDSVWVKILEIKIMKMLSEGRRVIVSDCRFDNEAEMIERLGGIIINVKRGGGDNSFLADSEKAHDSEKGLSEKYCYCDIVNDSTKESLFPKFISCVNSFSESQRYLCSYAKETGGEWSEVVFNMKKYISSSVSVAYDSAEEGYDLRCEWNTRPHSVAVMDISRGGEFVFHYADEKENTMMKSDFKNITELKKISDFLYTRTI